LVQVDEQGRATKRRLGLDELIPPTEPEADRKAAEAVVSRLEDERLLTTEAASEDKRPTVEPAHEALLRAWKRLADWIKAYQDDLRTRRRLDEAVAEWLAKGRDPSYLYIGARLALAEEWARNHPGELSPPAQQFLAACIAQRDEELTEKRQQRRRRVALLAATMIAVVLVFISMRSLWRDFKEQQQGNLAKQLADQAKSTLSKNPLISLLLAIEAVHLQKNLPDAESALLGALARSDAQPFGSPGIVAIAASADRGSMVAVGREGTATLWNLESGKPPSLIRTLRIQVPISGLALSSDRHWLLVKNKDGEVRLMNLEKGDQGTVLPHENWLPGDPFSSNSRWLITHKLGTPILHDLASGSDRDLKGAPELRFLAFSPDGNRLAVVSPRGAEIWNLQTLDPTMDRKLLPDADGMIGQPAFSPDSRWLAATVHDGSGFNAEVWPLDAQSSPGPPQRLGGCQGNHQKVAVSTSTSRGTRVLTWGGAGPACLWLLDGSSGKPLGSQSLDTEVKAAAFSSDGRWLSLGKEGGDLRLLDLPNAPSVARELGGQGQLVNLLTFAKGDRWLVTQGGHEAPRLWDLRRYPSGGVVAANLDGSRLVVTTYPGLEFQVTGLGDTTTPTIQGLDTNTLVWAFAPGGSLLAEGGQVRLWELTGGRATPARPPWRGFATSLAFSPDGRYLALGAANDAWLWDLKSNRVRLVNTISGGMVALAFDSASARLAIGWGRGQIGLFSVGDLGILKSPSPRSAAVTALAFSPDGKWLALAASNGESLLWGEKEIPFVGRDKQIRWLAISRDGHRIASGGDGGTLQLWSFDGKNTPGPPVVWEGHAGAIRSLSFVTEGGKEVLISVASDTVRRWPLETDALLRLACEKAGRNLTQEEWNSNAPQGESLREGTPCRSGGK
jgi:WD40 repeat protein